MFLRPARYFEILLIFILLFSGGFWASIVLLFHCSIVQAVGVGTSVTVEEIVFSIDSDTVNLGGIIPGEGPVTGTSVLTVSTSDTNGFSVQVKRNDSDTTLDLNDDSNINISDRTAWNPSANGGDGNAIIWQSSDKELGFRVQKTDTDSGNYNETWWGMNDSDTHAKFAGFPSSSQIIAYRTSASSPPTDSKVLYKLDVANTQPTGDYSGGITYTAFINP